MEEFFIGIPYVNRKDLLIRAIESIKDYIPNILIFDNSIHSNLILMEYPCIKIYKPLVPQTFALTMNTFNVMAKDNGQKFWLFMHNDTVASNDTVRELLKKVSYSYGWGIIYTNYDTLCAFNTNAFKVVGGFDINMPWYVSDIEFYERFKYYGYKTIETGLKTVHVGSQTFQSNADIKVLVNKFISNKGMEYYKLKWGAQHDHDIYKFRFPFDGAIGQELYNEQIKKSNLVKGIDAIYSSGHSVFNFSNMNSFCSRVELLKYFLQGIGRAPIIAIGDFSCSVPLLLYYLGYFGYIYADYVNVESTKQVEFFNTYQDDIVIKELVAVKDSPIRNGMAIIYVTPELGKYLQFVQDVQIKYVVVIYPNSGYKNSDREYVKVIEDSIDKVNYRPVKFGFMDDEFDVMVYERRKISINIITMWYNEEFFAPFFLSHYDYVDKIHVFIDADTNDRTMEICEAAPNVVIHSIQFKDGLDDEYRFTVINDFIATLTCDWVYVLDADEFIFPKDFADARLVLSRQTGNVMYADMYHVYRNRVEKDLTIDDKPVILQRRHGSYKSITNGLGADKNVWYRKPCIIKPETKLQYWHNGVHGFKPNNQVVLCGEDFSGAHWNMADEQNAIDRRLNHMKNRQSARNKELGQDIYKTEDVELIKNVCNQMLDEPQVF